MPKQRLPAIADRAVCKKITKGRAEIRRESVVEKVWRDIGHCSVDKFGGYKTELKERVEIRERLASTRWKRRHT